MAGFKVSGMAERWTEERCERDIGPLDELQANIMRRWHAATDTEREQGEQWYGLAHLLASQLCDDVSRGAAVAAALSPRYDWDWEVDTLRELIDEPEAFVPNGCGALSANIVKANDILRGYEPDEVLGGFKVRAFWRLLTDPYDPNEVCVDSWSFRVAVDAPLTDKELKPLFSSRAAYEYVQLAYRKVAADLGVLPNVVQAVTWCQIRGETWRGRRDVDS